MFGFGGSSSTPSPSASPTLSNDSPSMSLSSSDPKTRIIETIRQEAAVTNARMLIEKINDHCFERCVPDPGSSLSSSEQTCFSQCMEKYMASWNTVSRAYVSRLQR